MTDLPICPTCESIIASHDDHDQDIHRSHTMTTTPVLNERDELNPGDDDYRFPEYAWSVGFRVKRQRTIKLVHEHLSWDEASDLAGDMLKGWSREAGIEVFYFHYLTTHLTGVNGRGRYEVVS